MKLTMLKYTSLLLLMISILVSSNARADSVSDFVRSIGYPVFKVAWPTATYKSYQVVDIDSYSWGYSMDVKFKGESNMCLMDSCPLWFKLRIKVNNSFDVKDMDLVDHNALLAPPFATTGALAQAMIEANKGY